MCIRFLISMCFVLKGLYTRLISRCPAPPSSLEAIIQRAHRVQRWPNIQQRELATRLNWSAIVVVDYVSHIFATSVYDPVVSVKWQLVALEKEENEIMENHFIST